MALNLDAAIVDQLKSSRVRCAALVFLDFASAPQRVWSGTGDLRSMGYTWQGIGHLGALSSVGAGMTGIAEEMKFRLLADAQLLALAEADAGAGETQGRDVKVWLQFFDDRPGNEWKLLGAPFLYFWGEMGAPETVQEEADANGVSARYVELVATNIMANIARPPLSYFSSTDQRAQSSDGADAICDSMPDFVDGAVLWPNF